MSAQVVACISFFVAFIIVLWVTSSFHVDMKRKIDVPLIEKQLRITGLRHQRFVSQRALQNVVTSIQNEPLGAGVSRARQYVARKEIVHAKTPYGPLVAERTLKLNDGSDFTLAVASPLALMFYHAKYSESYTQVVKDTMAREPCTPSKPWTMIMYQDGVNPADGLAKNQSRNSATWYWSILEYGAAALGHEQLWMCPLLCRQKFVKKLPGEHIQLSILVLDQVFSLTGLDAERTGFTIELADGQMVRIYMALKCLLADEPALKELGGFKGHAGAKPCPQCLNCVNAHPQGGADCLALHSELVKSHDETSLSVDPSHILYRYVACMPRCG